MTSKNLLFFSLEAWNQIWRRNQFICALLQQRQPDMQLLWISPPIEVSPFKALPVLKPKQLPDFPNTFELTPFKLLPNLIGRAINAWTLRSQLTSAIKGLGWSDFIIWVNDQSARPVLRYFSGKKLIYDITDDWTEASMPPRILHRVEEDDSWLLEHADEVIVCSQYLHKQKSGRCKSLSLIPNAVDAHRYAPDQLARLQRPSDLSDVSSPIAGYSGTLHEDRLDIELIRAVAQKMPHVQFVFVGPDCLKPSLSRSLQHITNVHLMGTRSYQELPAYLASFDACIVPHRVSPFTESLDPLKLYEYLSTSKPVVSTACAGFREAGNLIAIADNAEQFATRLSEVLKTPHSDLAAQRIKWASEHTWVKRVEKIEQLLGWQ